MSYQDVSQAIAAQARAQVCISDTNAATRGEYSTYINTLYMYYTLLKHFQRMGAAMMLAFKELYPDLWTEETDEAWNNLYKYISNMMITGLNAP